MSTPILATILTASQELEKPTYCSSMLSFTRNLNSSNIQAALSQCLHGCAMSCDKDIRNCAQYRMEVGAVNTRYSCNSFNWFLCSPLPVHRYTRFPLLFKDYASRWAGKFCWLQITSWLSSANLYIFIFLACAISYSWCGCRKLVQLPWIL